MLHNYAELMVKAAKLGPMMLSIAAAQDEEVLRAVKNAWDAGLVKAILVGDAEQIKPLLVEAGLPPDTPVIHEPDVKQAALTAAALVKEGKAQILMKGLVNSGDFLKAVLNNEVGLRTEHLLSHLAAYEIPGGAKGVYYTDGGISIPPS